MANRASPVDSRAWQSSSNVEQLGEYLNRAAEIPLVREMAVRSLALMELRRGERVIDVGCGTGIFLPLLAEGVSPRGEVVGIDQAAPYVEQARQRVRALPAVRVDEGDAYALPYQSASFDAGHYERVLMHLADPVAAIREMRRVVRPGGRIVAVEPAWDTMTIDHPDYEAVDLLIRRANAVIRHPRMGIELNRLMAEADLVERSVQVVATCSRDYAEFSTIGLDLSGAARALAADGRLPPTRSLRILDELTARSAAGTYFGFFGVFVARGWVPA
jgi:SAM-dependent methyltransferase